MKRTSIRRKILFVVLGMSIVSLTTFCAAVVWGLTSIRAQMQRSSAWLGENAAENSSLFLEREAVDKLMAKARDRAKVIHEQLRFVEKDAVYFSGYATEIYQKAGSLPPAPVPYSSPDNKGKLAMQLRSANGEADLPRIKKEAYLLGNISSAYVSNSDDMAVMTVSVYLGTESGFVIAYDPFSDADRVFDPRTRPWYIGARESDRTFWTPPYMDMMSGKLVVTCSHPFYGKGGEIMGVGGIDVVVEDLDSGLVNTDVGKNGYAFIVDDAGTLVASRELKRSADGVYEKKSAYREGYPEFNEVVRRMGAGEAGFEKVVTDDGEKFIAFAPIPVTGWSVAIAQPVAEIMGLVMENSNAINKMTAETLGFVDYTIRVMLAVFVLIFVLAAIAIIYLSGKLSNRITKPVITLEECLERIAGGELDTRIELKTGDEIERLGGSVNSMAQRLKEYIHNLQSVTAEKERIGAELDVARNIQASMLPRVFPPFPNRVEFDIYASMQPAREVGGDFYDFFFVDDNTLAVVIADVSGKGVPAALFMAIAKTLIKNNAQSGKSPRKVFETVNNMLCENNDTGMFVTAFMGYFDIDSGKLTFVNAGHNPPILRANGRCEFIKVKPGFVLAGWEGTPFRQDEITLQKGDELFLYTDGLTEAVNNEVAMFGDKRLIKAVGDSIGLPLQEFAVSIKREIDRFAEGAEQADDITMLAFKYKCKGG